MTGSTVPVPTATPNDWPGYWFARLEEALHAGDFEAAATASKHLRRLGVVVTYPRPHLDRRTPDPIRVEVAGVR